MTDFDSLKPDPSMIGDVADAPFAILPEPEAMFRKRAARLRAGGDNNALTPYIHFLAALCDVQADCVAATPLADGPSQNSARPLKGERCAPGDDFDRVARDFFKRAAEIPMPEPSKAALANLDGLPLAPLVRALAEDEDAAHGMAEHIFVAAALQVYLTRLSARLDVTKLEPDEPGVCPSCGAHAASSFVAGWRGAQGLRFCSCAMCSTLWRYVRVRCVACGTTKGISYREIDGAGGAAKAECCAECGAYTKIIYQNIAPDAEPAADDILSLGLDVLVSEEGWRRAGFNPFLIGY
ncbi:MAG: formate dehydrogenase accessory protein FdhE [Hyphomicrobiales bacterium]|nr:formate dehydrogenase accessory protein FdhE [Hyphomicrobiales bacterium]